MSDTTAILARLAAVKARAEAGMAEGLDKWAGETAAHAAANHRWQNRSGQTEASIEGKVTERTDGVIGARVSAGHAAIFLETTKKAGEPKGERVSNGAFIRKTWAFLTPAISEKQPDLLKTVAEEAKL